MLWHAADAWVKGESPPRRPSDIAWESYPGAIPPTRAVRGLCGKAGVNSTTLCHPFPYRLHIAPLERGRWNPRKAYGCLLRTRLGRCRDVRPTRRASSVISGPMRPSPPLCRHPGHCSVIPSTVEARDDGTPPHPPLYILQPSASPTLEKAYRRRPNEKPRTTTLEAAPGQSQDSPRRPPEARFSRTTINSTTLCVMPPYVALEPCGKTVNRLPLC
jgi:hypothetical protein